MANYDNKLGEWFKDVEKRAQELVTKKRSSEESKGDIAPPAVERQPVAMHIQEPVREARPSTLAGMESREMVADVAVVEPDEPMTGSPRPVDSAPRGSSQIFEEADIPPVEDFFSFMSRTAEPEVQLDEANPMFDMPKDQGTLNLSEGTGIPRPVASAAPAPVVEPPIPQVITPIVPPAPRVFPQPVLQPKVEPVAAVEAPAPKPAPAPTAVEDDKWERMPHHLRILFEGESSEVAQNSYKSFKESRATLIERLLDPTISLEEAARILNVCPTTVRRYTNKGVLKHHRTAGNQRRFKLSDVLNFMETSLAKQA